MANYPGSLSTNANLYIAVNGLQTTLAASCTSGDTTLTLTSTTGFPTTGLVTIDNTEVVSYTGISGATLTGCTRGADGTTAAAHPIGVTVGLTVVAAHHNLLKDEIIAIETALGVSLANVFPATPTTGTGNVVLQTSPTLITPALGTPSSVNLANATNLPNSATTATPNATASTIMSRDASVNTKINEMIENFSTTVTAAGTTTLTVTSSPLQQFTGTSTQTVTLPDATTLAVGFYFTILNRSTGAVTVNKNGGTLQATVPASSQSTFVCTSVGSAAGTWDTSTSSAGGITAYREDYVVGTALNNYTGSTTVFNLVTPYSVGGHSLVVTLDGDVQTIGATIDYQETNSTTVTFNNALVSGEKVSFIFQTATSSGGTVNSGTAGQIAYYPATGPTVSGTNDPTGISSINSTFIGMGRNRLINGEMAIDQVNGGALSTFNANINAYFIDQWVAHGQAADGVFTIQRVTTTPPTGFKFYQHTVVTTADASIGSGQRYYVWNAIEGTMVRDFLLGSASAVTFTLSFWVRSSLTGTFGGSFQNSAGNRSYVFNYTINSANTWEKKTITLVGDTTGTWINDTGLGLFLAFDLGSGSTFENTAGSWVGSEKFRSSGNVQLIATNTATWDLTGVQVEIGPTATTFEYRSLFMEVALCQRYFEKSYDVDVAVGTVTGFGQGYINKAGCQTNTTTVNYGMTDFKVPKRVTPTLTLYNPSTGSSGSIITRSTSGSDTNRSASISATGLNGAAVNQSVALDYGGFYHYTADARF